MKALQITHAAHQVIQAEIRQWLDDNDHPWVRNPILLSVLWNKGTHDNRRSVDGQVVWEVLQEPGWVAVVVPSPFGEEKTRESPDITIIDGLWVRVADTVKSLPGTVTVDEASGKLFVRVSDE